jgi:hypothetical protein
MFEGRQYGLGIEMEMCCNVAIMTQNGAKKWLPIVKNNSTRDEIDLACSNPTNFLPRHRLIFCHTCHS